MFLTKTLFFSYIARRVKKTKPTKDFRCEYLDPRFKFSLFGDVDGLCRLFTI